MRLLALKLLGFKSFPDQTELRFGPGVTAVVGPNGSGKSNIVDAIRWVLGEQNSRALRSPRSTDLIFGGTAQRKPLGMGQVTLVIDNSDETIPLDYSEISIVRRVHRSGESEFFINGAPCRLRDIQQLLLGTGLGRGGMAVVGQGEIDAILSADPSERRLLIEETAGTSRYTAQKRLAEQRLQRAGQDLARVLDLAVELSARADTLTEQAKLAARYRELAAALQAHRASRAARDWLAARARLRQAEEELASARERLAGVEKEAAASASRAQETQAEIARLREQLDAARTALHEAEAEAAGAGHRLELAEMQQQSVQQRLESLQADLTRLERERSAAEAESRAAEEAAEREQVEAAALKESLAEAEARLAAYDEEYSREAGRLEAAREQLFDVRQKLAAHAGELERLGAAAGLRAQERARWQRTAEDLDEQAAAARGELEQARREVDAIADRLQDRRHDAEQLALALQAARADLDARRRAEEAARGALQEVQAHRRALLRLEENYEGYRPAVRAVLTAARQLGGIRGTVAQLVDVPARYNTAVQVALGAATQYVIVDDERAVLRAIEYLRKRKAGRATFISLDTVRPRGWPADRAPGSGRTRRHRHRGGLGGDRAVPATRHRLFARAHAGGGNAAGGASHREAAAERPAVGDPRRRFAGAGRTRHRRLGPVGGRRRPVVPAARTEGAGGQGTAGRGRAGPQRRRGASRAGTRAGAGADGRDPPGRRPRGHAAPGGAAPARGASRSRAGAPVERTSGGSRASGRAGPTSPR